MDDRYGISGYFTFDVDQSSIASIETVEQALGRLERASARIKQAFTGGNIGQTLKTAFNGAAQGATAATQKMQGLNTASAGTGSKLNALKAQFRAIRAEARNIDYGDLDDPNQFKAAKTAVNQYIESLKALESQITGDSMAERQFRAELQRTQTIAQSGVDIKETQRDVAKTSQRLGMYQGIQQFGQGVVGAISDPMSQAGEFSKQSAGIVKLADFGDNVDTAQATKIIDNLTLQASTKFAQSAGTVQTFLADMAGSGTSFVDIKEIQDRTNALLQSKIALDLTTDATSSLGIQMAKIDAKNAVQNIKSFSSAVNVLSDQLPNARIEASGVIDSFKGINDVVGNAANFKLSDQTALAAVLSSQGVASGLGGSFIGRLDSAMFAKKSIFAQTLGMDIDQFTQAVNTNKLDVIAKLASAIAKQPGGDLAKADLFNRLGLGQQEDQRVLKILSNNQTMLAQARDLAARASLEGTSAQNEVNRVMQTGAFQTEKFQTALANLKVQFGLLINEALLPVVTVLATVFEKIVAFTQAHPKLASAIAISITAIGALSLAVGTVGVALFTFRQAIEESQLAMTLFSSGGAIPLTGFFETVVEGFTGSAGLTGILGGFGTALTELGTTIEVFISGSVMPFVTAIGLPVVAFIGLQGALGAIFPGFNLLGTILSGVAGVLGFFGGLVYGVAEGIWSNLKPAIDLLKLALAPLGFIFQTALGGVSPAIQQAIDSFKSMALTGEQVGRAIGWALSAPFTLIPWVVDNVIKSISGMWSTFATWLTDRLSAIPKSVSSAFSNLVPPFLRKEDDNKKQVAVLPPPSSPPPGGTPSPVAPSSPPPAPNIAQMAMAQFSNFGTPPSTFMTPPAATAPATTTAQAPAPTSTPNIPQMAIAQFQAQPIFNPVPLETQIAALPPIELPVQADTREVQAQIQQLSGMGLAVIPTLDTKRVLADANTLWQTLQIGINSISLQNISAAIEAGIAGIKDFKISGIQSSLKSAQGEASKLGDAIKGLIGSTIVYGVASLAALSPMTLLIGGIAFTVVAISTNFLGLRTIVIGLGKAAIGAFETVRGALEIVANTLGLLMDLTHGVIRVFQGIPAALRGDFSEITAAFQSMGEAIQSRLSAIGAGFTRMGEGIRSIFEGVFDVVRGVFQGIEQVVHGSIAVVRAAFIGTQTAIDVMGTAIKGIGSIVSNLPDITQSAVAQIQERWASLTDRFNAIRQEIAAGWSALTEHFQLHNLFSTVQQSAQATLDRFMTFRQEMATGWSNLAEHFQLHNLFSGVGQAAQSTIERVTELWRMGVGALNNMPLLSGVKEALQYLPNLFEEAIAQIKAKWNGLGEKITSVFGFMRGKAKETGDAMTSNLSENSPGPTYQIRMKWAYTANVVQDLMSELGARSQTVGAEVQGHLKTGFEKAEIAAKTSLGGIQSKLKSALSSEGAGALGRSASSVGMALSNFAPGLAQPLFVMSDLIGAADDLSESLPKAKKFFTDLIPQAQAFAARMPQAIELFQGQLNKLAPALTLLQGKALPLLSGLGSQFMALIPIVTSFAASTIAAIAPIVTPFLPIIAIIAAVGLAIFGLKAAFDSNFLGIKTIVLSIVGIFEILGTGIQNIGSIVFNALIAPFEIAGQKVMELINFLGQLNPFRAKAPEVPSAPANQIVPFTRPSPATPTISSAAPPNPPQISQTIGSTAVMTPSISEIDVQPSTVPAPASPSGPTATPAEPMIGAVDRVQNAWTGFVGWFGGAMGGMVSTGEQAGEGLVNALNHNPTVRIPIAWEGAIHTITGFLDGLYNFAVGIGDAISGVFRTISGVITGVFREMGSVVAKFGLSSVVGLAPMGLALGAISLLVVAVSTNFLGLRSVVTGIMDAIGSAVQGVATIIQSVIQTISGLWVGLTGMLTGNLEQMKAGFTQAFSGISGVLGGIVQTLQGMFGGLGTALGGILRGVEQIVGFVMRLFGVDTTGMTAAFRSVELSIGNLAHLIGSVLEHAWDSFLAVLDFVESKIRGVSDAIVNSPIGKMANAVKLRVTGKAPTMESAQQMADFDQRLSQTNPEPKLPISAKLNAFKEGVFAPKSQVADPTASPSAALGGSPTGMSSANQAFGAFNTILGAFAPAVAGALSGVVSLFMAIGTLITTLPALIAEFAALGGITGIWGTITTTVGGAVTAAFTSVSAAASAMWSAVIVPALPAIAVIAALAAAVGVLFVAYQNNFLGIKSLLDAVFGTIGQVLTDIFMIPIRALGDAFDEVQSAFNVSVQSISEAFDPVIQVFSGLFSSISGEGVGSINLLQIAITALTLPLRVVFEVVGAVIRTIGNMVATIVNFVGAATSVLSSIVAEPLTAIGEAFGGIFAAIGSIFTTIGAAFAPLIQVIQNIFGAMNIGTNQAQNQFNLLKAAFEVLFFPLRVGFTIVAVIIRGVGMAISGLIQGIGILAGAMLAPIRLIGEFLRMLQSVGGTIFGAIGNPIQGVLNLVGSLFNLILGIPQAIINIISIPFNAIMGFLQGVGQAISGIPLIGGLFSAITGIQAKPTDQPQTSAPMDNAPKFASGGMVGGSGIGDTVRAWLTPGEFVNTPESTLKNLPLLQFLNGGGDIGSVVQQVAASTLDPLHIISAIPDLPPALVPPPPIGAAVATASPTVNPSAGDRPIQVTLNFAPGSIALGGGTTEDQAYEIFERMKQYLQPFLIDSLREAVDLGKL